MINILLSTLLSLSMLTPTCKADLPTIAGPSPRADSTGIDMMTDFIHNEADLLDAIYDLGKLDGEGKAPEGFTQEQLQPSVDKMKTLAIGVVPAIQLVNAIYNLPLGHRLYKLDNGMWAVWDQKGNKICGVGTTPLDAVSSSNN